MKEDKGSSQSCPLHRAGGKKAREGTRKKAVRQRKTNILYHLYVESKETIQVNLFAKQKQTHRYREQIFGHQQGEGLGRDKLGFGINRYTPLSVK